MGNRLALTSFRLEESMSYLDERTELTFIRIIIDVLVFGVTVKTRYRFLSLDKRRLVHVREKNFIRKDEILTVRS